MSVLAGVARPARSADGRGAIASWCRRPAAQGLAGLAIYLAAWLVTAGRSMPHHLADAHLDQSSMDPNFYAWSLRWWPYALGHGLNPLYTSFLEAPQGHSLAWVTTAPPLALLAAPLTLAAGPVVTFNLLAMLALPVSAWAGFVLCRRVTGRFWPALAGGAVFGFSAYQMNHVVAGQLNLIYSLLVPLAAWLVVCWYQAAISTRAFVICAGLMMAVQFYLFLETFADLTGLLLLALPAALALAGPARRSEVLRLAKGVAGAWALALALALPYLAYALAVGGPKLKAASTSLDLSSLVIPRPDSAGAGSWLHALAARPTEVSTAGYIGLPLLAVAVVAAVTWWSSRLVRFLTCMLALVIAASLGPALTIAGRTVLSFPWAPLWHLPVLRNAYPVRLMLFAYLILAVLTALWLARPASRHWLRLTAAVLVVAALWQDAKPIDIAPHGSLPDFISAGSYRRQLSPGETVVVVSQIGNLGMLWQADTGFYPRLAGGYINQAITKGSDLPGPVQNLSAATPQRVAAFENYVRRDHIGAVLLDSRHAPAWAGIFRRIGLDGHRDGTVIVYPIGGCRTCVALGGAHRTAPVAGKARRAARTASGRRHRARSL